MPAEPETSLSVILPAHNSAAVIERTVARLRERLAGSESEIIVVENGSTDETWAIAQRLASDGPPRVRALRSEKGMGNALRAGIEASTRARVLLSADDLPFGFDDLDRAAELEEPAEMVIGSKAHPRSQVDRGGLRSLSTWGFRVLRRVILGSRVGDSQGTILADGPWLRAMAPVLDSPGFLFSTQLCFAAELQRLRVVEVPVRLAAEPKVSTVRLSDVWAMGAGLLVVRRGRSALARPVTQMDHR